MLLKKPKTIESIIAPIARIVAELEEFASEKSNEVEATNLQISALTKKADEAAVEAANATALSARYRGLLSPADNVKNIAAE